MWNNKSGDMKQLRCVFLVIISLVVLVNNVYGGYNLYDQSASIGSSSSSGTVGKLIKKHERTPIVSSEFGDISAVDIDDGVGRGGHRYHIQFITLEPNALFLPVVLHSDMIFYVQTGNGKISWADSDEIYEVDLKPGDLFRLRLGTFFYLHSSLKVQIKTEVETQRPKLKITAIFVNPEEEQLQGPSIEPYMSINEYVRGFDKRVLQATFQVPEEVVEELTNSTGTQAIVNAEPKKKIFLQKELRFINSFLEYKCYNKQFTESNKTSKKKYRKTFNFFKEDPDFKNCNGWSTVVTEHNMDALEDSRIGAFMLNLTKGSMMGPHWNPMDAEVSVVLEGVGMVRVVCQNKLINKECKNSRLRVQEGDVFTVPRFHPMAQTSFNNGSFVIMGFSTIEKKHHLEFLTGKDSILQTLSKSILSASLNVSNTTIAQLLDNVHKKEIILDCTSCAKEQEMLMEEEIEKERQEKKEGGRQEEGASTREKEEEKRRREKEMGRKSKGDESEKEEGRKKEKEMGRREEDWEWEEGEESETKMQRKHEEQKGQEEIEREKQRGEGESEQEIARKEEKERREWQRQAEEVASEY